VYRTTSRVSVLKFAAATSISIAAVATALPGIFGDISDLASASVPPTTEAASLPAEREALPAEPAVAGTATKAKAADLTADLTLLTAPYDPAVQPLRFAARSSQAIALDLTYSTFALPAHRASLRTALARTPQPKPGGVFTIGPDGAVEANSTVLAYAAPTHDITAPFEAVMGGPRISALQDEDTDSFHRPRPRPDPDIVLDWLDGRALGQFAPGQHEWVRNPLPASVFSAKEQKCLAQGVYFEARSEPEEGQAAVAQVILNRVRNPAYPNTICGVVFQNQKLRNSCQFSFACDGKPERVTEQAAWKEAEQIALGVTNGKIWIDEVGDSTHYYADYVRPRWSRKMIKKDNLGQHIFFRTRKGGWS
jgi:hypothetical protein